MGVPGWPLLAASTASIARVRMVLIDNCSMLGGDSGMSYCVGKEDGDL